MHFNRYFIFIFQRNDYWLCNVSANFLFSQIPKLTFAEPIHVLLVFAKDVRRKDRQ